MHAEPLISEMPPYPVLFTTGIPKEEIPKGLSPSASGTEQCDCADCESNDCGPNGP